MVRKLRVGVLSTARIGLEHVIPAMKRSERCEVVAIASRDERRARSAVTELQVPRSYGDYAALLNDAEVDAVYIPLPNHLHEPWTLAAAEAGKHVLCEKPLAPDVNQARRMTDGCRRADVILQEGFMYRFHPQWRRVLELVTSGRLGQVRTVQSAFSYDCRDPQDIVNIAAFGGGALLDIGCYAIDLARMVFDAEPQRSVGSVHIDASLGTDVHVAGLLEFSRGRQAVFTSSSQAAADQWVRISGSEAHLLVELPFNVPWGRPARLQLATGWPSHEPRLLEVAAADQYALQADAFVRTVLDGRPMSVPSDHGIGNLQVIEQLRASANPTPPMG